MAEILFVDDEPHILKAMQRLFHGHHDIVCHFANSAMAAVEIITKHPIAVVISDHRMPQMDGADFLAIVSEKRPNIVRMMLTGQADLESVKKAVNRGNIFRFILKPWNEAELIHAVEQAIEYYTVIDDNKRLTELSAAQNKQLQQFNEELEKQVKMRTTQLEDALHTASFMIIALKKSVLQTARSFFALIELTAPDIAGHSRRVAGYALKLGRRAGLDDDRLQELEVAALLHDLGKIGLPPFMLEKDISDYSADELNLYHGHPLAIIDYFQEIKGFENILVFIRAHHERYNGAGFPFKLKGGDVPLEAYIIGVCDMYDYDLSHFGKPIEHNYRSACQHMANAAAKEFPSDLVYQMLECAEEWHGRQTVADELPLALTQLTADMILTRDIRSANGTLLLPSGTQLQTRSISRLRTIDRIDPLTGDIYVARQKAVATPG